MKQKHDLLFQVLDRFVCTLVGGISPLFEIYTNRFCSLINAWNEKAVNFIEHQSFRVLSNFMTEEHQSSHNKTAASAWQQQNA
jgi:hypothetical protein